MDTSALTSSTKIQMDYMKLLVTQLQNQNPLEPLDNNEMASQLAQFSQLGQLESMNSRFAKALEAADRNYAASLIGKEVTFIVDTPSGDKAFTSAVVQEVLNDLNGQIAISAGNYALSLNDIISVKN